MSQKVVFLLLILVGISVYGWWAHTQSPSDSSSSGGGSALAHVSSLEEFRHQVLDSSIPVVVDYSQPGCPPCRRLTPILEKLQNEYSGRLSFIKVNVRQAGQLARAHGIRVTPTVRVYRNATVVTEWKGFRDKRSIRKILDPIAEDVETDSS